ncbi:MAG TPA: bacterial transcriptional activator domain-containing protein [Candidatus Nitrosotalea sp.]|nr:bacterial transcriptional activator domain-containing protein [Candidatus Nitrosotalea sp.]
MELILFLASATRPVATSEIVGALWPDSRNGSAAVRMYVARVRRRLGQLAIAFERGTYALGAGVFTDLIELERTLRRARRQSALTTNLRVALSACLDSVEPGQLPSAYVWEWFGPTRVRIEELVHEAATLLARDALDRGDFELALNLASRMLVLDLCDETARELRVLAYAAKGDRARAYREVRVYRETLKRELSIRPSGDLMALLHGPSG